MIDYAPFDHPSITSSLFHPRHEEQESLSGEAITEISIGVDPGISVGGKVFFAGAGSPALLFFHGNGEIVIDYDDLGPLYQRLGITFIPVDYRGYGRSGGSPSVSSMMKDCHAIFEFVSQWRAGGGHTGAFIVMGRSLGSAPALELASSYPDRIHGLIIDSGFARALPLLRLIGVHTERLGLREEEGFHNPEKTASYRGPTLIIHARNDHIIPYDDGVRLFESSCAAWKKLVTIEGADHNTIFMFGLRDYMAAVRELTDVIGQ